MAGNSEDRIETVAARLGVSASEVKAWIARGHYKVERTALLATRASLRRARGRRRRSRGAA